MNAALSLIRSSWTPAYQGSLQPHVVYVLVKDERIIYVGQTNNIGARLALHLGKGLVCDVAYWHEVPASKAAMYEGALARALQPPLVRRAPRYQGGDNIVRAEFGLPLLEDEPTEARALDEQIRRRNAVRVVPSFLGRNLTKQQRRFNQRVRARRFLYREVLRVLARSVT